MRGTVEEYIWNESPETIVYERDGIEKRLTVSPNMMLTRMCHVDTDKYLIDKLEKANETAGADQNYERFLENLETGYCNFCEVLAVGKNRDWTKEEQKKYKVAKRWSTPVEVGDFVLMPEMDKWGRMWRYIFGKPYMHMAETRVPILIIRKEDNG